MIVLNICSVVQIIFQLHFVAFLHNQQYVQNQNFFVFTLYNLLISKLHTYLSRFSSSFFSYSLCIKLS